MFGNKQREEEALEKNYSSKMSDLWFTGTQINYHFICKTKLWLFSHNITMEQESELVSLGKYIHETSYTRKRKEIQIGNIKVDYIKKGEIIEIHDIKKSRKMESSHKWQLLYYLYYFNKNGIKAIGVLDYPLLNKHQKILPKKEDFIQMEEIIKEVKQIITLKTYPEPKRKKLCLKCSYYEFCFGD